MRSIRNSYKVRRVNRNRTLAVQFDCRNKIEQQGWPKYKCVDHNWSRRRTIQVTLHWVRRMKLSSTCTGLRRVLCFADLSPTFSIVRNRHQRSTFTRRICESEAKHWHLHTTRRVPQTAMCFGNNPALLMRAKQAISLIRIFVPKDFFVKKRSGKGTGTITWKILVTWCICRITQYKAIVIHSEVHYPVVISFKCSSFLVLFSVCFSQIS